MQSGLLKSYREKWASFAYFEGKGSGISLHLRLASGESVIRTRITVFEFGNPRRLRNLRAVQHLTRESTGGAKPQIDKKQSIFSSAHQGEQHTIVCGGKWSPSSMGKGPTLGAQ